ncbi:MAG: VOC family protein [Gemmataceae bacterium]
MSKTANPTGYHTVTPYLTVPCAAEAIAWYTQAFGAVEKLRLTLPGGGVAHAEIAIGDSPVMLGDECPAWGNKSPKTLGGVPGGYCVYVPDVDAAFAQAVAAGGTVKQPVADQFYGDRSGSVVDPFGHVWTLATRVKDMTAAEMQAAMDAWMASMPAAA